MPQTPGSGKIQAIKRPRQRNALELLTSPYTERVASSSGNITLFADKANDKGADDRDTVMQARADASDATAARAMSFKGEALGDSNEADLAAFHLPMNDAKNMASATANAQNYQWEHRPEKAQSALLPHATVSTDGEGQ